MAGTVEVSPQERASWKSASAARQSRDRMLRGPEGPLFHISKLKMITRIRVHPRWSAEKKYFSAEKVSGWSRPCRPAFGSKKGSGL